MRLEFQYISANGEDQINLIEGSLTDAQKKSLCKEVTEQSVSLIAKWKQGDSNFRPESPIKGLPKDIVFKYTCTRPPHDPRIMVTHLRQQDFDKSGLFSLAVRSIESGMTHLWQKWQQDTDKAGLFSLAAPSIKSEKSKSDTSIPKNQDSDDGSEKSKNIFVRFFKMFFRY